MKDVAVIGGGAAGLCAAVMLKMSDGALSATVFEAAERVGRKLAVTGNGRCNISNKYAGAGNYHGDPDFARRVLNGFDYDAQKDFFAKLGIIFTEKEDGKAYPMSLQAASVADALRFKAEELGVEIRTSSRVDGIIKDNDVYSVSCGGRTERFKTAVIACGGMAGGRLGGGDGYRLLKGFGHKIENIFPAAVQLKTTTESVRQLKGIKVTAVVTAESDSGKRSESGEVLFCDYGLSGPPVLQVSRLAEGKNMTVALDVCPELTEEEIAAELRRRISVFPSRPAGELLSGLLNKRLGQVIVKQCGVNINDRVGSLTADHAGAAAGLIKNWKFRVNGTTGFDNAQVTAGGASTAQFFDSCMSKKSRGLFAVGEVLDVDGDCGGFNLAFAWASAHAAAEGIVKYLKEKA